MPDISDIAQLVDAIKAHRSAEHELRQDLAGIDCHIRRLNDHRARVLSDYLAAKQECEISATVLSAMVDRMTGPACSICEGDDGRSPD